MDAEFWLNCWHNGHTGFHRGAPLPLLEKHWPTLGVPNNTRVFVPLAGKSLDMVWLAAQGYRVLGVELSPLAVEQFFGENRPIPMQHSSSCGEHFVAGRIEIIQGNVFGVDAETPGAWAAEIFRAAKASARSIFSSIFGP